MARDGTSGRGWRGSWVSHRTPTLFAPESKVCYNPATGCKHLARPKASFCRKGRHPRWPSLSCAVFTGKAGDGLSRVPSPPDCSRCVDVALRGIVPITILSGRLNFAKHLADRVHHLQQRRRDFRIETELPFAEPRQHVSPNMSDSFKLGETRESARFPSWYRSCGIRSRVHRDARIFFQADQLRSKRSRFS